MIDKKDVLSIHKILIEKYGGKLRLRDDGALDSAINRPYGTFDGQEFYSSPIKKAAAILESLVINHPFIDGNKRIGYVMMRLILLNSHIDIEATEEEKYNFVIGVASGIIKYEEIEFTALPDACPAFF